MIYRVSEVLLSDFVHQEGFRFVRQSPSLSQVFRLKQSGAHSAPCHEVAADSCQKRYGGR